MLKSPNDHKEYLAITLDNGLRVLLVENMASKQAAAALAVNTGHFSDPAHRQGMAHFLEHMLFLGTEKYPDGSEYQKFISQYGGNHNAWTATEHTCFFFDIHHQYFNNALDRFSSFFICPLLSEEFVNKERQNIDAEFKLKLKDDIRRLYDVHKETINPAHPFSQFSVGNIDTLADQAGSSLQQEISDFFEKHYCAQLMTLSLEAPLPLNELKQLAKHHFSGIKARKAIPILADTPLYLPEHQKVHIKVKPVKKDRRLLISFAMPSIDHLYHHKPESLLAYLLGHEGSGSILSYLKKHQWAFRLTAGSGISGYNFKDFNISITLTEQGEQHINEIVDIVFAYINLLKNTATTEHYYQEKKAIAQFSFQYQETSKPLDSVSQLAMNMQYYPAEHYIFGDYAMEGYRVEQMQGLLDYLQPNNMRLMQVTSLGQFDHTSKWYQVPYSVTSLGEHQLNTWQQANKTNDIYLPPANQYIVAKPTLVTQEQKSTIPEIIYQKNGFNCWFKQDQSFNVPKGYIYLAINCPKAIENSTTIAMTRLFIELYNDNVLEENYDAELAGIHYHLYSHQGGLTLQLSGISEKQPLLLTKLLQSLKNQHYQENKFSLIKNQLIEHWRNADKSKSISQLFSLLSSTMQPSKPGSDSLANALAKVELTQFKHFSEQLFNQVQLELLIHGNWQKQHALAITDQIEATFAKQHHQQHQAKLAIIDNTGMGKIILPTVLPDHDHATVLYYPLADKSLKTTALTMVISQILAPHFFQQMRTEKQFGYLVGVGYMPIGFYPGIAFYIQSPDTDAQTLAVAIDEFINISEQLLAQMTSEALQQLLNGLAGQLQEKDVSLRIKSQRFWSAIAIDDHQFSRKQQLITIISKLTKADLKSYLLNYLTTTNNTDRILLLSLKSEKDKQNITGNIIESNIEGSMPLAENILFKY